MKHDPKLQFCMCDDCAVATASEHGAGDALCGREWSCQCGTCQRVRKLPAGPAHVAFARLEALEKKLAQVRALKAL